MICDMRCKIRLWVLVRIWILRHFGKKEFTIFFTDFNLHDHANQPKRKRSWSRAVFSNLQRKGLEKRFEIQKYVTKPDRRQLAAMLGLTDAQVSTQVH